MERGGRAQGTKRTHHVHVSWPTSPPVRSKSCLTGGSPTCTRVFAALEQSRGWAELGVGVRRGQMATDATCQVPVGPAPDPQLR